MNIRWLSRIQPSSEKTGLSVRTSLIGGGSANSHYSGRHPSLQGIVDRVRAAIIDHVPDGYEDETGFHVSFPAGHEI